MCQHTFAFLAIATVLSRNPSRHEIAQTLHDKDFDVVGVTGKIQFLPSGDRVPNLDTNDLFQVQYLGESGYQFVPISLPP